jgi:hypothetical protein
MVKIPRDDSADLQASMMGWDNMQPIKSLDGAIKSCALNDGEDEDMVMSTGKRGGREKWDAGNYRLTFAFEIRWTTLVGYVLDMTAGKLEGLPPISLLCFPACLPIIHHRVEYNLT